MGHHSSSNQ
nr:unnamed protein product [Callosobruchus analis]